MSSSGEESWSWISWYCNFAGNKFLCKVDKDYIRDDVNLQGLDEHVPLYKQALEVLLDTEGVYDLEENPNQSDQIEASAEILYGLIHARYILSERGIAQMIEKYRLGNFGVCQRVSCNSQNMLPLGLWDNPGEEMVKCYCPKCKNIYTPKSWRHHRIDGSFFGTMFPYMFFKLHPKYIPKPSTKKFVPRLFGFKIHPQAYYQPRRSERLRHLNKGR